MTLLSNFFVALMYLLIFTISSSWKFPAFLKNYLLSRESLHSLAMRAAYVEFLFFQLLNIFM